MFSKPSRKQFYYSIIHGDTSITYPPMNCNACWRARKAENQEQWKKRTRISSQPLNYLTWWQRRHVEHTPLQILISTSAAIYVVKTFDRINHKTTCYPPFGKKRFFSHGLQHNMAHRHTYSVESCTMYMSIVIKSNWLYTYSTVLNVNRKKNYARRAVCQAICLIFFYNSFSVSTILLYMIRPLQPAINSEL